MHLPYSFCVPGKFQQLSGRDTKTSGVGCHVINMSLVCHLLDFYDMTKMMCTLTLRQPCDALKYALNTDFKQVFVKSQ